MNAQRRFRIASGSLAVLLAVSSSLFAAEEEYLDIDSLFADDEIAAIPDPLRPINKAIFHFNDFIYIKVFKPVSQGYQRVMPDPAEKSVGNFFGNLKYPVRLTGNLMQGKIEGATQETGRFLLDSTVGIGGLFRPSANYEMLNPPKEDISQGLASWGFGNGFYLVIPFAGPSTLRDAVGGFGDSFLHPISEPWSQVDDTTSRLGLQVFETINESPALLDAYDTMKGSAIDPYESLKDAYIQRQNNELRQ